MNVLNPGVQEQVEAMTERRGRKELGLGEPKMLLRTNPNLDQKKMKKKMTRNPIWETTKGK